MRNASDQQQPRQRKTRAVSFDRRKRSVGRGDPESAGGQPMVNARQSIGGTGQQGGSVRRSHSSTPAKTRPQRSSTKQQQQSGASGEGTPSSKQHGSIKKTHSSSMSAAAASTSVANFFNNFRKRSASSRTTTSADDDEGQPADEVQQFIQELSDERVRRYEMPSSEGLDFAIVAGWAKGTLKQLMAHPKGKQMFRHYLQQSLADENLQFYDAVELMSRLDPDQDTMRLQTLANSALTALGERINLKTELVKEMEASCAVVPVDLQPFLIAQKDIYRLMSSDQFSRFKLSPLYIEFLESLLTFEHVIAWAMSFDALLHNHIGNWRFRRFLKQIKQDEKLKFIEAVAEYKQQPDGSKHQLTQARDIFRVYCKSKPSGKGEPATGLSPLEQDALWAEIDEGRLSQSTFDGLRDQVHSQLRQAQYTAFIHSSAYRKLLKTLC